MKVLTLDKSSSPRRPAPRSWPRPLPPRHRLAASRGPSNDYQNDTELPASDCRGGRREGCARRAFKFSPHSRGQRSPKRMFHEGRIVGLRVSRTIHRGVFNPCTEFAHDSFISSPVNSLLEILLTLVVGSV